MAEKLGKKLKFIYSDTTEISVVSSTALQIGMLHLRKTLGSASFQFAEFYDSTDSSTTATKISSSSRHLRFQFLERADIHHEVRINTFNIFNTEQLNLYCYRQEYQYMKLIPSE
jgi:hypothetical protein